MCILLPRGLVAAFMIVWCAPALAFFESAQGLAERVEDPTPAGQPFGHLDGVVTARRMG